MLAKSWAMSQEVPNGNLWWWIGTNRRLTATNQRLIVANQPKSETNSDWSARICDNFKAGPQNTQVSFLRICRGSVRRRERKDGSFVMGGRTHKQNPHRKSRDNHAKVLFFLNSQEMRKIVSNSRNLQDLQYRYSLTMFCHFSGIESLFVPFGESAPFLGWWA